MHAFDFHATGIGGYEPESPLVEGSDGSFYGVASGGDNGVGTIFKVSPAGSFTSLYSFNVTDGSEPIGGLVQDGSGTFYGMTRTGGPSGSSGFGTIFKITSAGALTTLHAFTGSDAGSPSASGFILAADGNLYATTQYGGHGVGTVFQCTTAGALTDVYNFTDPSGTFEPEGALVQARDGSFYGTTTQGGASGYGTVYRMVVTPHPPFFNTATDLANGVEYLQFAGGNYFGYFSYLADPHYIYHFDLGYEYVFDAADGESGVYLYDFTSSDFFYTSPTFPFPYLYDFELETVLYYYPDPGQGGHYDTDGVRYFYDFATGKIISK